MLLALVAVELTWGFSMVTFETLTTVRLADLLGDPERAASLMGPVASAAWFASAAGAALVTVVSARLGVAASAALMRVLQGATVLGIGLALGPVGLVVAHLATYAVHGAANPLHSTLLHRQVGAGHRSTVLSLNSMVSMSAGSAGTVVLTAVADGTSVTTACALGALVLALGAPLYLPAWRRERALAQEEAVGAPWSGSGSSPDSAARR